MRSLHDVAYQKAKDLVSFIEVNEPLSDAVAKVILADLIHIEIKTNERRKGERRNG